MFVLKSMQRYKEIYSICINYTFLTLTLTKFELRVLLVDDEQTTFTTNDFAIGCTLL